MMNKVKVLIVDDSVVYRSQIRAALQSISFVEVAGAASNGRLAIERLALDDVDVVILDLEMPEMDGIQTLKEVKKRGLKCRVLLFSSYSKRGAEITMEALSHGASDFVAKPGVGSTDPGQNPAGYIRALLEPKLQALSPEESKAPVLKKINNTSRFPGVIWDIFYPKLVVIGSSTGGPTALENIFSQIRGPLNCPIIIVQHMPPIFTTTLAERISKITGIKAVEAVHGDVLEKNCIYVVPGDYHLRLEGDVHHTRMLLSQDAQINSVRPAVDPLFATASNIFKEHCLGLVLTGMGMDGRDGALSIKENGGAVVIQDQNSCVVFGMPGAVFNAGAYDRIESLENIVSILHDKVAPYSPIELKSSKV